MKLPTKLIHAGVEPDPTTGAIMTPIYQTSTYVQSAPGVNKGYEYARSQNPTRFALESALAHIENGKHGLCFGSGVAATDAVLRLLVPGDEVIAANDMYGGTYRLFTKVFEKMGIKFHFVNMQDAAGIRPYINAHTKLIWAETPTNPLMNIVDIAALAAEAARGRNPDGRPGQGDAGSPAKAGHAEVGRARKAEVRQQSDGEGREQPAGGGKILLCVDNTFASPYLQNPLDLGADIVLHSATKYLGGHSDVIHGCLIMNSDELREKLYFIQKSCGAVPGPQDCFLVLRGIKTLHVRMDRHCSNGAAIAHFLRQHPKVGKVYWCGFPDHPGYAVASRQMRGFGGMMSFTLKDDSLGAARKLLSSTHVFALAESLGGVESLINHPASMTHASIPREERLKNGLSDSLIRLSVGIEDVDDLKEDLRQAIG